MPRIRFVRGVVFDGEQRGPGEEAEVSDKWASILCDGYKDAVRVDGSEAPKLTGMTVKDSLQDRVPTVAHRDPVRKK